MNTSEHRHRHTTLHRYLDELVGDWIYHTGSLPSKSTVMELLEWSYKESLKPTDGGK